MGYFLFQQESIRDPFTQLAWEEAIALSMRKFGIEYGIRIWRNPASLVLGISEKESQTIENSYLEKYKADWNTKLQNQIQKYPFKKKIPTFDPTWIVRRASGGGTVFQNSLSNLNFSLFLDIADKPELYPVQNSYQFLLGVAIKALAKQDIAALTAGKSDISLDFGKGLLRKISGNAQFRKKDIIVQHGTLILDDSIFTDIERYQLHPPEEPEYRAKRTHRDFLSSLSKPLNEAQFADDMLSLLSKRSSKDEFKNLSRPSDQSLNFSFLKDSLRLRKSLLMEKYSQNHWLWKS